MLLLDVIAEPIAKLLHIPFGALLVVTGSAASKLLTANSIDTGLRWQQFNFQILHVFVSILVLEPAFNMRARQTTSPLCWKANACLTTSRRM